jgi:type II secretory pathway pseudopilin PulG
MKTHRHSLTSGFTLVETAISLVLLALATATVVTVLQQQITQHKMTETDAILASARDALLNFETAYGYLPCPATAATNGQEAVTIAAGVRTCTVETGFLPAVTLGMPNLDQWGLLEGAWHDASGSTTGTHLRAIRYSLASLSGAGAALAQALTRPGLGAPTNPLIRTTVAAQFTTANNNGLFVCYSSNGILPTGNRCGPTAANTLAGNVAAIVWSLGYDAPYLAQYSSDEKQNEAQTVARVVISHNYVPSGAAGGPFDDQVVWIPYATISDRLVYGGFDQ